ncbi:MAG: NAD(P)/FAD-dependent oxidoreductase [Candidatus Binataceae bacterium]
MISNLVPSATRPPLRSIKSSTYAELSDGTNPPVIHRNFRDSERDAVESGSRIFFSDQDDGWHPITFLRLSELSSGRLLAMALTRNRKLRTSTPVWIAYPRRIPRAQRLKKDLATDVLVVGAGISGALIAYSLAREGHRVAMIDRRGPIQGSTPASTALLLFEIDTPLIHLKRRIGAHPAERAWLRSKAALDALYDLARREKIDAAMSLHPSVYLAGNVLDARGLAHEADARQRLGLPSRYLGRRELHDSFRLSRSAAIVSEGNIAADPRALASGFIRRAHKLGARLFAPHEIMDIQSGKRSAIAVTKDGFTIEARQIVLCTGYELPKIVPSRGHSIASTWVIATKQQPQNLWPHESFIWEASDPYLYLRATIDGRIICGGEDEDYADAAKRDAQLDRKAKTLERKLARMLPKIDPSAQFAWTASFGQSNTGLPSIGKIPGLSRCYAVLGYGGNGITFSMLAAQLISAAIGRRRDPDAELFAFRT